MPPVARPIDQVAPSARYRYGVRDDPEATQVHADQSRDWRRRLADAEFPPTARAAFLAALDVAGEVKLAAAVVGTTAMRVYGRMSWDPEFADEVDRRLAAACRATAQACGTVAGYREGGRCASCRAAKRADRGPRQPRQGGHVKQAG